MNIRMRVLGSVVCAAALMATGCGNLTIRELGQGHHGGAARAPSRLGLPGPEPRSRSIASQGGFLGRDRAQHDDDPGAGQRHGHGRRRAHRRRHLAVAPGHDLRLGQPRTSRRPERSTSTSSAAAARRRSTLNVEATAGFSPTCSRNPAGRAVTVRRRFPLNGDRHHAALERGRRPARRDGLFNDHARRSPATTVLLGAPATFNLNLARHERVDAAVVRHRSAGVLRQPLQRAGQRRLLRRQLEGELSAGERLRSAGRADDHQALRPRRDTRAIS